MISMAYFEVLLSKKEGFLSLNQVWQMSEINSLHKLNLKFLVTNKCLFCFKYISFAKVDEISQRKEI